MGADDRSVGDEGQFFGVECRFVGAENWSVRVEDQFAVSSHFKCLKDSSSIMHFVKTTLVLSSPVQPTQKTSKERECDMDTHNGK